jgi:hypothetical protein
MHGLYLLWWVQERHVPVAFVATILAASDLAVTALEIPTGWFADRRGHRLSLIAGSALQIAGMVVALFGRGVSGLLASCLLIAAGDAFRSGADQALLYRSCLVLGRESDFQTIEGRTRGAELVALVGLVLAGGAIVEAWGFSAGWLIEAALCAVGLAMACAMVEPLPRADQMSKARAALPAEPRGRRSPAGGDLKRLVPFLVPAAFVGGLASAATFLAQTAPGTTPGQATLIVASVTLAEAAGALVGARIHGGVRTQYILGGLGIAIAALPLVLSSTFLPTVLALCFLMGLAYPLRAALVQKVAAETVRARAASLTSACDKAFGTATLLCAGVLPGRRPVR